MTTQMGVLLDLVDAVQTNMETICTLAINIQVPKEIIMNLSVAKLTIIESKIYLSKHLADRFTMIESTSMDNSADKDSNISLQQIPELPIDPDDIKNEDFILDSKEDSKADITNDLEPSMLLEESSINDLLQSSEVFCEYEFENNPQAASVSAPDKRDNMIMEKMEDENETNHDDPDYNDDDMDDIKSDNSSEDEMSDDSENSGKNRIKGISILFFHFHMVQQFQLSFHQTRCVTT